MSSVRLAGLEVEAVEFEEESTNHKPRPLVAIDKRMVADDASRIQGGHFDDIRRFGMGVMLTGTRQR